MSELIHVLGQGLRTFQGPIVIHAGSGSGDTAFLVTNVGNSSTFFQLFGDGHGVLGANGTNNLSWNTGGNFLFSAPGSGVTAAFTAVSGGVPMSWTDGTVTANIQFAGTIFQLGATSNHGTNLFTNNINRLTISNNGAVFINPPSSTGNFALAVQAVAGTGLGSAAAHFLGASTSGQSFGVLIDAGTTNADAPITIRNQSTSGVFFQIFGDGHGLLGAGSPGGLSWNSSSAFSIAAAGSGTSLTVAAPVNGQALIVEGGTNTSASYAQQILSGTATGFSSGLYIQAGTNSSDIALNVVNAAGTHTYLTVLGNGATSLNATSGIPLSVNANGVTIFEATGTAGPTIEGYGPNAGGLVDMTPDKGSFTATVTGGPANVTCSWVRNGSQVTLWIPALTPAAASGTTFTFTGLPAAIQPATLTQTFPIPVVVDNSTVSSGAAGGITITAGSGTVQLFRTTAGTGVFSSAWTNSGNRGVPNGQSITYQLT